MIPIEKNGVFPSTTDYTYIYIYDIKDRYPSSFIVAGSYFPFSVISALFLDASVFRFGSAIPFLVLKTFYYTMKTELGEI